jgi:hypothetical protein
LTYFCSRLLAVVLNDEVVPFTPFLDKLVFLLALIIEGLFSSFRRISLGTESAYPPFFHLLLVYRCRIGLRLAVTIDNDIFRAGNFARL